jgi:hypothetical protein
MALHCEKGLLPLLCREPVAEQCLYCGKHFCVKHGHVDKATCGNFSCMQNYKRDRAIKERELWEEERRRGGIERNAINLCGHPECVNEVYVACGHCEVLFCPNHVSRRAFSFNTYTRRSVTRVQGDIILCEACLPYLKEYKKDRYE